ncbi:hypothetical protein I5G61_gp80 [Mycobacterium phage Quesadilla]|uniref:Uncharacterized protein n=1 Tax=Mycobacterium phage Quesadilla TaxID=2664226 RepID=A0A5Q2WD71_9CAUD|nr:hypothetical protein I5G61_gp80 [Mycobacterium phage Quesadilla]QGH75328.1 hypothetical protein SEA_QUESADILLA_80 [Mycobacterium phage Quesadilla]
MRRLAFWLARWRWPDAIICPFCRQRWRGVIVPGWRFPVHYTRGGRPCPGSMGLR